MYLNYVEKALLNGVSTAGVGVYLFGINANIGLLRMSVPLYVVTFTSGVLGSIAGDVVHENISHNLPIDRKIEDKVSLGISCLVNGIVFYSLLHACGSFVSGDYGFRRALLTGAGAELVSSLTYNILKNKI